MCVENIGSADSPSFVVSVNGMLDHGASTRLNQLASGEFRCLDFVYDFSIFRVREPFIHVDILSEVVESDERNNTLNFPQPSGTQCDIICPDYAPAQIQRLRHRSGSTGSHSKAVTSAPVQVHDSSFSTQTSGAPHPTFCAVTTLRLDAHKRSVACE